MATIDEIFSGKICPYCDKQTEYVDSVVIYGKSYGMIYLCKPCDAYVGVHKGTDKSLGRLADKELRYWKKMAHASFDKLWRKKMMKGINKHEARTSAYKWLSNVMDIDINYTHIGMFDIQQCKTVVEICKKWL